MSFFQWLRSLLPRGGLWQTGAVMFLKISDKWRRKCISGCVCTCLIFLGVCVCFWAVVAHAVYLWECLVKLSVLWQASGWPDFCVTAWLAQVTSFFFFFLEDSEDSVRPQPQMSHSIRNGVTQILYLHILCWLNIATHRCKYLETVHYDYRKSM